MYKEDHFNEIPVPENLEEIIDKSIEKGVIRQKKNRRKKIIGICSATAASLAMFMVICFSFPSFAAKLPLIGKIFEQVEEQVSYKGKYSQEAQVLVTEADNSETADETESDNAYIQTSNGITITISEVYYNSMAMYMGMRIESEEPFPEDFVFTENMEGYILDYDFLTLSGEAQLDFMNQSEFIGDNLEGRFEDLHTFVGIYRVDIAHLQWWPTEEEMASKGLTEEKGNIDTDSIKEAFPKAGALVEVPDTFRYSMKIESLSHDLLETIPETYIDPDGNEVIIDEAIVKKYTGEWNFEFDVVLDRSKTKTVIVNETNESGLGIAKVEKTPYEVKAEEIWPEGEENYDYFTVICDADGDQMDFQGTIADTYQTYGRNTDTVYVYICDYEEYMNEIKGYYWAEDYEERRKTKTFKEYLDEKALYGVEVTF